MQRAITQKVKNFLKKIHQVIFSLSSIGGPSLKLLALIVFEITLLKFSMPKFAICNG